MSKGKSLSDAGFQRSSTDANKWVKPTTGHWVKEHEGGNITISTSRHNTYDKGMSDKSFRDRLNK